MSIAVTVTDRGAQTLAALLRDKRNNLIRQTANDRRALPRRQREAESTEPSFVTMTPAELAEWTDQVHADRRNEYLELGSILVSVCISLQASGHAVSGYGASETETEADFDAAVKAEIEA